MNKTLSSLSLALILIFCSQRTSAEGLGYLSDSYLVLQTFAFLGAQKAKSSICNLANKSVESAEDSFLAAASLAGYPSIEDLKVHSGEFAQVCQVRNKNLAMQNFERIVKDITHVNLFGERSRTGITDSVNSTMNKSETAAKVAISTMAGMPVLTYFPTKDMTAKGLAEFKVTHNETHSGPPPNFLPVNDSGPNYSAEVGDLISITPPKAPIQHYVKVSHISGDIDGKKIDFFSDQGKQAREAAMAAGKGVLTFSVAANPSYNPNLGPENSSKTEHFYDRNTQIEWKVSLDLATGSLKVITTGSNERCNVAPSKVQTYPGTPISNPKVRAAMSSVVCNFQWNAKGQDLMWVPFTESFLKDFSDPANPKPAPGIDLRKCRARNIKKVDGKVVYDSAEGEL